MLQRLLKILFSTRLTGILLIAFALAMAIATFIENDYGTETAKALIYSAKWFEVALLLLAINFAGNIAKYNLVSLEKAPIFIFHVAFILIILGAGVTKYRGFEALMTIKEKEASTSMVSIDSYLQVQIGNEKLFKNYAHVPLLMSELGFNNINESYTFEDKEITLKLKQYVPRATYKLTDTTNGHSYLHVVVADREQRKDFYIKKGTRERIYGTTIAFDTKEKQTGEIYITSKENTPMAVFPEDTNYFSMVLNKASFYPKDSIVPLQFKALSTIKETPFVFNTIEEGKIRHLVQKPLDLSVKNPESAIVLSMTSDSETKDITLFGGRGYLNPKTTTVINGLHVQLRYGSKPIPLDFSLYLDDFTLERYPGSDSPSAFYSDIEVQDKTKVFDYRIFMNNVLDYKGYRFFQSAYLPDESGTILSVNHDYWGTLITYIGYALLGLGMLLTLLWRSKFIVALVTKTTAL